MHGHTQCRTRLTRRLATTSRPSVTRAHGSCPSVAVYSLQSHAHTGACHPTGSVHGPCSGNPATGGTLADAWLPLLRVLTLATTGRWSADDEHASVGRVGRVGPPERGSRRARGPKKKRCGHLLPGTKCHGGGPHAGWQIPIAKPSNGYGGLGAHRRGNQTKSGRPLPRRRRRQWTPSGRPVDATVDATVDAMKTQAFLASERFVEKKLPSSKSA